MKKSDLKTGMRVVYRNGSIGIILADVNVIALEGGGFNLISNLSDDLVHEYTEDHDGWNIVSVYGGYQQDRRVLDFKQPGLLIRHVKEKSESQKQLDLVLEKLAELQKEAEQLQETIKKDKK